MELMISGLGGSRARFPNLGIPLEPYRFPYGFPYGIDDLWPGRLQGQFSQLGHPGFRSSAL